MLLTDKCADKIYGTITCYDCMIIQGYIPRWSHAEGMTSYPKANKIRIFDFSNFSQPFTEQVRANAQRIADENDIEIEFIRKLRAFRKDDRIQEIIQKTGRTEGLIHIFSAMEQCNTYKPWHDKTTGKTSIRSWMLSQNAIARFLKRSVLATHGQSSRSNVQLTSCLSSRVT